VAVDNSDLERWRPSHNLAATLQAMQSLSAVATAAANEAQAAGQAMSLDQTVDEALTQPASGRLER
jgi:hypothetical protein